MLRRMMEASAYPADGAVFSSPMKRCIETARLIYPASEPHLIDGLRECDFGDFEGKTYAELCNNSAYQRFLDSGGNGVIPNGESTECYKKRCLTAFAEILRFTEADTEQTIVICHGGTIMAILERYHQEKKSFYDYQVENCGGYIGTFDERKQLFVSLKKISVLP